LIDEKNTLFLLLLSSFLKSQSQINKETIPDQKGYINDLLKGTAADSTVLIEKVCLYTGRTYYYLGDDIWFKAMVTEHLCLVLVNGN
jgi:hypothetical protein